MRARIAAVAGLVSLGIVVAPAWAEECLKVDRILEQCLVGSEPEPQPEPEPEPQPNPGHRPAAVNRILTLMNGERAAHGLPSFALRTDVSAISAPHSEAMAAKGTIWHNDAYFTAGVKRSLGASLLGENVARNTDIDDAHRRLMNSPGHRANLLDRRFTVVGLAVFDDGWGNLYVTQNFVQPRPTPPPPPPAPAAPAPQPVAASVEQPRSAPPTTRPPAPTTTTAPAPAPAVLAAAPTPDTQVDVVPADAAQERPAGPNPFLLGLVALLALGSVAAYAFRSKLHFFVPSADR